jgi:hypothetical protein
MIPEPARDQTATSIVLDRTSSPPRIIFKQGGGAVGELRLSGTSDVSWEFFQGEQTVADLPYRADLLLYSASVPEGAYCRECEEVIGYTHEDDTRQHFTDHASADITGPDAITKSHVPVDAYSTANDLRPMMDVDVEVRADG